jgi:hypothetical protein
MSDDKLVKADYILGDDDKGFVVGSVVPAKGTPPILPRPVAEATKELAEVLGQGTAGGGKRFNAGKNRMELTLPEWDWALADVSTKGSLKYDPWNWLEGMDWSSMIGCMKRHLAKFEAGERYDGKEFNKELGTTGCHHLAMVAWNALALMTYDMRGIGNDDRAKMMFETLARVNAETSDLGETDAAE